MFAVRFRATAEASLRCGNQPAGRCPDPTIRVLAKTVRVVGTQFTVAKGGGCTELSGRMNSAPKSSNRHAATAPVWRVATKVRFPANRPPPSTCSRPTGGVTPGAPERSAKAARFPVELPIVSATWNDFSARTRVGTVKVTGTVAVNDGNTDGSALESVHSAVTMVVTVWVGEGATPQLGAVEVARLSTTKAAPAANRETRTTSPLRRYQLIGTSVARGTARVNASSASCFDGTGKHADHVIIDGSWASRLRTFFGMLATLPPRLAAAVAS